jgi:hypothetical protein
MELFDLAKRETPSMMAFVFRWMGFNGWMAAVSGCERDFEMINALAAEPRMILAYDQLMAGNLDFQQAIKAFAELWPVLNVSQVRAKLGYDAFRRYDRAALIKECDIHNVKRQPATWVTGTAPNWEKVLRTIYQVRCNFFHGEKSMHNDRDRDLVLASDRVLSLLLAETGCLGWHDR